MVKLEDGVTAELGDVLARAGEGTLYDVVGHPNWVAKMFHPSLKDLQTKIAKVKAMTASQPPGAVQPDGFVVLTWPLHVVEDTADVRSETATAGASGYIMHKVDTATAVEIHCMSNPSNRMNPLRNAPQWTKNATWPHLVNVAANLCLAVGTAHRVNAVIGDFQERKSKVTDEVIDYFMDKNRKIVV